MLSGPIDIDKMDYLERDSLHAGVPYGRNFDRQRLIGALCVDASGSELAISVKGKTAAEMMVFARYVMFSEVYWHHAVRSATAMLQRAVFELQSNSELIERWPLMIDAEMIESVRIVAKGTACHKLVEGLFGDRRTLYKRIGQYDCREHAELHQKLARRPYGELVDVSVKLARLMTRATNREIAPCDVLIDAPPVKLEVQFRVAVRDESGNFGSLEELSPVVRALATQQFDDVVKKVRVFVTPELRDLCRSVDLISLIHQAIDE
jgi:uncharacterized protein